MSIGAVVIEEDDTCDHLKRDDVVDEPLTSCSYCRLPDYSDSEYNGNVKYEYTSHRERIAAFCQL